MSVAETLLVYVAAPLIFTAVLAALTLRPDAASRHRRYRPGQPWEHEPLWYAPHGGHAPVPGHGAGADGRANALGSSVYGELEGGPAAAGPHLSTGGAAAEHGSAGDGATAASAGTPVRGRGGPLGGARGTW